MYKNFIKKEYERLFKGKKEECKHLNLKFWKSPAQFATGTPIQCYAGECKDCGERYDGMNSEYRVKQLQKSRSVEVV